MIETYLLEQLAAFAKFGTLSESAKRLYISQPALSRSMQKLERILGVELFSRAKNRIALNETGKRAAIFAQEILNRQAEMVADVREFDRKSRTISIGCCAPVPLHQLTQLLSKKFPGVAVSSELNGDRKLLQDFQNGAFELVVLHEKPADESLFVKKFGTEKLYISLPVGHPLANSKGLRLEELNGLSILLYSKIGFWYDLCVEKIPRARFLLQCEREVFAELASAAAFPSFTSDIFIKAGLLQKNSATIPILDAEADVTYYLVCKQKNLPRFQDFCDSLDDAQWDWRELVSRYYFAG